MKSCINILKSLKWGLLPQKRETENCFMKVFQKNLANDVTSWECEKRRRGECKAKIELDEAGNFLERINNHTHAPSETKCEIAKVRANIKRRATETQDPAQVILGIELGGISEAAAINLPALIT